MAQIQGLASGTLGGMSYLDNIESAIDKMESRAETDPEQVRRERARVDSLRAEALAAAPYAEELKKGPFTAELLTHATRMGFGRRAKVQITWMGTTLRLETQGQRLELRPTGKGVIAASSAGERPVDLNGNAEELARSWFAEIAA